ncbi:MAG: helix-turn-helix transcriptional regulator [Brevinematales bacterium]
MQNERLKTIRNSLGLTQKEFAGKLDLKVETYKNYEFRNRDIPGIILEKLISVFNINLNWLVSENGSMFEKPITKTRLFQTFDLIINLSEILPYISKPVVNIIVETEPSSAWNLPCLVLESFDSGEWYLFGRSRIAFQGNGGGYNNMVNLLTMLKKYKISIGKWTLSRQMIDDFEAGLILWSEIKKNAVPALSAINEQDSWQSTINQMKEMFKKEYNELSEEEIKKML